MHTVRDNLQLCIVCVHSLITRLQLMKISVMYESAHDAITFHLLEMSSITTHNQKQFRISAQGTFFKGYFTENIGDLTRSGESQKHAIVNYHSNAR